MHGEWLCSGTWTELLRKLQGERKRREKEKRDKQNELEVTVLFYVPRVDICRFCLLAIPLCLNRVLFSFRDYLTPIPYVLGITERSNLLASCSLSRDSRQKKVALSFWWLSPGETVSFCYRIPGATLIPVPPRVWLFNKSLNSGVKGVCCLQFKNPNSFL